MRWLNLAFGAAFTLAEFFIHGAAEVCGDWNVECEEPTTFRLADSTDCGGTCDSSTCCEEAETCGDWEEDCPDGHVTLADSTQCMLYIGIPTPCDSTTCCEEAEICEEWDGECPDDHVTLPDDTFCWGLCDESTCCEKAEICEEWDGECPDDHVTLPDDTFCWGLCDESTCCEKAEICEEWDGECPDDHVTLPDDTFCWGLCDESTCCEKAEICEEWDGECPDDHVTLPDDTFCWGLCDESTCCEKAEICEEWDGECPDDHVTLPDDTFCWGLCDESTCCEKAEICEEWDGECPDDHVTLPDDTFCWGLCDESTCCEKAEICEEWDGECPDDHVALPDDTFCWGLCDESTCCEEEDDDDSKDDDMWGDPHMRGLRGQRIDWYGVDGGWYSLIKDDNANLNVNIRVTAPLPDEFPNRQLMTGLMVLSEGHSLVIEVANPYTIETDGCPEGVSPCLANGGLRTYVDGQEADELLRFSRHVPVGDGAITLSASNLPVECRQFGGDKIWSHMYKDIIDGRRQLLGGESLEEWILRYDQSMPARRWCAKYIADNGLADLQSTHAVFKIETSTVTVRLNAGVNYQGEGALDWDGRVLPDLEFWQMDVGMDGLDVENPVLSGLLGETARPTYEENGKEVMAGFDAFRGTVEDYRVSSALGVHFPLLDKKEKEEGQE